MGTRRSDKRNSLLSVLSTLPALPAERPAQKPAVISSVSQLDTTPPKSFNRGEAREYRYERFHQLGWGEHLPLTERFARSADAWRNPWCRVMSAQTFDGRRLESVQEAVTDPLSVNYEGMLSSLPYPQKIHSPFP